MNEPQRLPPQPLAKLLSLLLRGERGEVVLGDLEEAFHKDLEAGVSRTRAAHRFLRHGAASIFTLSRETNQALDGSAKRADRKGDGTLTQTGGDLGFAIKSLWRRPGFSVPVVLTLALGMGVSATVFSVVEAVLIRQPAFEKPEELVMIWSRQLEDQTSTNPLSGADYHDLLTRSSTLEDIAGLGEVIVAPVIGTEQPSFARFAQTSANIFDVLGVEPVLGRNLERADQTPLAPNATERPPTPIMLSHQYWVREFGADPNILGHIIRTFTFDNIVVGVLPPDFTLVLPEAAQVGDDLGAAIDLWSTYRTDYSEWDRDSRGLVLIARMAEGRTLGAVRGELDNLAAELRREIPDHEKNGFSLGAESLVQQSSSHLRPLLMLLSAAVLCVLLVACVNASGLLLARMVGRSDELAIRTALGAGRLTLARLVFIESLVLAGIGGLLGLAVAASGMELLKWLSPAGLPQAEGLHLNRPVLVFSLFIVPFTAIVAGLVPTLRAGLRRMSLQTRGASTSASHRRLGEAMVATQIALTVLLLVGTGLMLRSFSELREVPLGFDPSSVLTVDMSTVGEPPDRSNDNGVEAWVERRWHQERALSEAIKTLPGVRSSGAIFPVPLNGVYARTCTYSLADDEDPSPDGIVYFRNVWPGYFDSVGIPLLGGRDFTYDDDDKTLLAWTLDAEDAPERTDTPRVIVDARLATRLWPGENPVGRRLTFATFPTIPHDAEVIGVVPFVPQGGIEDAMETIYIPRSYYRSQELTLTVKLDADSQRARQQLTQTIRGIFPDSPVAFVPLTDYVGKALAPTRFVLTLLGAFAVSALFLASIGLYATMALMVRTRTNEFGIHLAMGAPPTALGRRVVVRSVALASIGVVFGLGAAVALSRFLESYLVEISATDPVSLAMAASLQLAIAALAAWIPARRAAAVDPVTALRID